MDKSSHPVQRSDLVMPSESHPAFSSPRASQQSTRAASSSASTSASSQASISSSLSINHRQKRDSFMLAGSVFLITADGKTLSLPVPSQSPYDPLNWTWRKRVVALFPIALFSILGLVLTQGASLNYVGLSKEFSAEQTKPFTTETLVTAPTLFMGLGPFLWVPLTYAFGRRPPFILASIMLFVAALGAAIATNFRTLLVCVCALGFAEGFALSVILLMLIDMSFIHQRPLYIASVWSVVGFMALFLMGTVPYTTEHGVKWRRMFYFWSIPAGFTCLFTILFFPETLFKRPIVAYDGLTILQTASEKLTIYEDEGANLDWSEYNKTLPDTPNRNWAQNIFDQVCLRVSKASWKKFFLCYPQILFCLLNPLIFWVVILTAINFAGMMFIGATYSLNLTAEPYKLPSHLLIVVNMSAGIGSLCAWALSGTFVCYILKRMSKKNKGVREAEHYLIGYIFPVLSGAASTALYGLAVEHKWHFTLYYLAYGLNGFSFASLAITNTLWVTEAFPRWAAPALVVVGGGSYILSFAISFALVPWIMKQGYMIVGIELTALQIFSGLVILPIVFWGKGLRQKIHGRWAENRDGALRPL